MLRKWEHFGGLLLLYELTYGVIGRLSYMRYLSGFIMRTFCVFFVHLFFTGAIAAQDWAIFQSNRVLNFSTRPVFVETTLYAAQKGIARGDSFFVMAPRTLYTLTYSPYLVQIGSFLGDTLYKRARGVYEGRYRIESNAPTTLQRPFTLQTQAEVGTRWRFRDTVSATIMSKTAATLWGRPDSIKTVRLGTGEIIRFSKNLGILQWDKTNLLGLQGAAIGTQLPTLRAWYGWQVGDVFVYKNTRVQTTTQTITWQRETILERQETANALTFSIRLQTRSGTDASPIFKDTVVKREIKPLEQTFYAGTDKLSSYLASIRYGTLPNDTVLAVTIANEVTPSSGNNPYRRTQYGLGLGLVYDEFRFAEISYRSESLVEMLGYQKVGQAPRGNFPTDAFFGVSLTTQPKDGLLLRLHPNPAQTVVHCNVGAANTVERIEVFNANQCVLLETRQAQFSVQHLPAGLYWVRVATPKGSATRPLVVQP